MPNTQELRRKIASIRSTAKLTKAMQMVAAAKMSRAIERAVSSRAYTDRVQTLLRELSHGRTIEHELFAERSDGKQLLILLTSNRGLAGAFNTQVIRNAVTGLTEATDIVAVGRKGQAYLHRFHPGRVMAEFPAADGLPVFADASAIAHLATTGFVRGTYREVVVVYTRFESMLRQQVLRQTVLPIRPEAVDTEGPTERRFEPSPGEVLDVLLRRSVPVQLFQLLIESTASEHAARMLAMKNATENATEIVDDLTLTYQSVRQAGITRQIIEIASGAAALGA